MLPCIRDSLFGWFSLLFLFIMIEFQDFSVLCWNIRGAINVVGRRHTRELINKFRPSMVILVENHCAFSRAMKFWKKLGYDVGCCYEANGQSGGIWILIESTSNFSVQILDSFHQAVTVSVCKGNSKWCVSAVYASHMPAPRDILWDHLISLRGSISEPWLLMGDFNEILLPTEVRGGNFIANRAAKFSEVLDRCGLLDLKAKGGKFTWFRKTQGNQHIHKRLDRAFSYCNWRIKFPEAFDENLPTLHSDHCPILLRCNDVIPERKTRPFWFQAAWLSHNDFPAFVHEAWGKGNHGIPVSLDNVKKEALDFNGKTFGNIFKRKHTLENRMKGIQRSLKITDSIGLTRLESELQKEYSEVLKQEEMLWFQKSREKWVKLGDRNTKFFDTQTIVRRKRNKIHGVYIQDEAWCTDPNTLRSEALDFFRNLFMSPVNSSPHNLMIPMLPELSDNGKKTLTDPVCKEEVKLAVFSMGSFKAPGPDGFQPLFFKHLWSTVGNDMWQLVKNAFERGYNEESIAEILIVLIPKIDHPVRFREFRPISLCNVVYITNILRVLISISLIIFSVFCI